MRLLDSGFGQQVAAGRRGIGNDFRHQWGSGANEVYHIGSRSVRNKEPQLGIPPGSQSEGNMGTSANHLQTR